MGENNSENKVTHETFKIINRLINIFGSIISVFLLLIFISIIFYLILPLISDSVEYETFLKIDQMYERLDPIMNNIWNFIKPLIQFIIIIFILKWVVLSSNKTSNKLQNLIKDIPSFIALIVITTLCLIPLVGYKIPSSIANIALVIVGFYFGNKFKKIPEDETNQEQDS